MSSRPVGRVYVAPGLRSNSVVRLTATAAAHLLTATGRAIRPSDGQVGGVANLSALSVARFLAAYRDDSAEALSDLK